jgi:plastocyanin
LLVGVSAAFLVLAVLVSVSLYLGERPAGTSTPPSTSSASKTAIITIPQGSFNPPPGFNTTALLANTYHYPFNFTVVVGINNTVKWVNDDQVEHNVSSFLVPPGATTFDSDLIQPHDNYSVTLTVAGVYKYTCIWHPWLAGEITVKA